MEIYIFLMIFSIIIGFFVKPNESKKSKKIYLLIVLGAITIVSSVRHFSVGIDLRDHYYLSFLHYIGKGLDFHIQNSPYDTGFILFYRLIYFFTNDPQWMIAVHAIIVNFLIGLFIYKNSDNVETSVFIYITYNSMFMYMTMLRQSLAIVFVLLAMEFLKKNGFKNKIEYLLFMIVAVSMHSSALIMFACPFLSKIKINKKNIFLIIICSIIAFSFYGQLFNLISSIIPSKKDYGSFYSNDISIVNVTAIYSVIVGFISLILSYFFIYKNRNFKDVENDSIKTDYLVLLVIIFTITRLLRLKMGIMARVSEYFLPFIWILFPRALENIKNGKDRMFVKTIIYAFFILAFIWGGYSNAGDLYGTVPYKPFWK